MKNFLPILFVATVLVATSAFATKDVTAINVSIVTGSPSVSEGVTFDNSVASATSFATATANYIVASLADNVFVRRNGINSNNSSVWYAGGNAGANYNGVHQNSYDQMLLTNNVYIGTDNTFANGTITNTGNIERLDFTWNNARTASAGLRFGVFDRGAVGVHDSFAIAAITAIDASGNPTDYGSLLRVTAGWGGTTNAFGDQFYHLFRYNNGDNITASTNQSETNTQGFGGILISTSELGIANGTQIYGYSLMSNDVNDPLDLASFPTNTNGDTGGGGIDLAAINGFEIQGVPEPSTILLSLGSMRTGSTFTACDSNSVTAASTFSTANARCLNPQASGCETRGGGLLNENNSICKPPGNCKSSFHEARSARYVSATTVNPKIRV